MSVSPVGCSPKEKANRKSAELRSAGDGSTLHDYCEADRANAMSETAVRILLRIVAGLFSEGESESEVG